MVLLAVALIFVVGIWGQVIFTRIERCLTEIKNAYTNGIDLGCASLQELQRMLASISELSNTKMKIYDDKLVVFGKYGEHDIFLADGFVTISYPKNKIAFKKEDQLKNFLKIKLKLNKTIEANYLMSLVATTYKPEAKVDNSAECERAHKLGKQDTVVKISLLFACMITVISVVFSEENLGSTKREVSNNIDNQKYSEKMTDSLVDVAEDTDEIVKSVKNGYPNAYKNITYGDAFTYFFEDPSWISFVGLPKVLDVDGDGVVEFEGSNYNIVEFTGKCYCNNVVTKVLIQFVLSKDDDTFIAAYLSYDDKPQSCYEMYNLFDTVFEEYAKEKGIAVENTCENIDKYIEDTQSSIYMDIVNESTETRTTEEILEANNEIYYFDENDIFDRVLNMSGYYMSEDYSVSCSMGLYSSIEEFATYGDMTIYDCGKIEFDDKNTEVLGLSNADLFLCLYSNGEYYFALGAENSDFYISEYYNSDGVMCFDLLEGQELKLIGTFVMQERYIS